MILALIGSGSLFTDIPRMPLLYPSTRTNAISTLKVSGVQQLTYLTILIETSGALCFGG